MYRLEEEIRSDIRFFAFWVSNGTLIINETDTDYRPILINNPKMLEYLFILYLNNFENDSERETHWLRSKCEGDYKLFPVFDQSELSTQSMCDWKLAIIEFTSLLVGKIEKNLQVPTTTIISNLMEYGSSLELVYAVLTNNFTLTDSGKVNNRDHSFKRATEAVMLYVEDYKGENPEFEAWEVELV